MIRRRSSTSLTLSFMLAALTAFAFPALASAQQWAPAGSAAVTPGVQTNTEGSGQCTSNFIFEQRAGKGKKKRTQTFIGQAAHCAGTGAATETDGCDAATLPLGTRVDVDGAKRPGKLVYSSWLAMQEVNERDRSACAANDFALVKLARSDVASVNPSVPVFGGPRGLGTADSGEQIFSYGNSSLRGGIELFSPKAGLVVNRSTAGWTYNVYTLTPGIPGDSGSGFLSSQGEAFGVLSTLALLPLPASNGVSDLGMILDYARDHGFPKLKLVNGTEPFTP